MKARVRKSAAEAAETKPTNRLTGITVNEVSIVDLAANQKKFLVVKEAPPPPPAPPATPPVTPPPAPAPSLTISPELKAKVVGVLKIAQEKIALLAKALEVAVETPNAPAPQELLDQLAGISGLFAATPAAPAPPAPPHPPVQKAGKKISAARLAQLLTAKTALDAILTEVNEATAADDAVELEPEKTEKNDPAVPPVEPPPAAAVEITEIRASLEAMAGMVGKIVLMFEGQNQRIDSLAKARGQSQQTEIDKATTPPKRVAWDMDMAKPPKQVA